MSREGFETWLGDYQSEVPRTLAPAETAALGASLRKQLRSYWRARHLRNGLVLLVVLASGTFFALKPADTPGVTVLAAVGVAIVALAPIGVLLEIAFGRPRWLRWPYAGGTLLAALCLALGTTGPRNGDLLGTMGAMFASTVGMGGIIALLFRWRQDSKRLQQWTSAMIDLENAEVLPLRRRGSRPASNEGLPKEIRRLFPKQPDTLEVLPRSRLLYRVDDQVDPRLIDLPLQRIGLSGFPTFTPVTTAGERPLSSGERDELTAMRPRFRRKALGTALYCAWFAGVIMQIAQRFLAPTGRERGEILPALGMTGILIALGVGGVVGIERLWFLRRLSRDEREGKVRITVAQVDNRRETREALPHSGLRLRTNGHPSRWRTYGLDA